MRTVIEVVPAVAIMMKTIMIIVGVREAEEVETLILQVVVHAEDLVL